MEVIMHLKRGSERRILGGHPWIFSNEVEGSLKDLPVGGLVQVHDSRENWIGWAGTSRGSLICARILERSKREPLNVDWFAARFRAAAARRAHLNRDTCRVVFAESDDLPGLIVDRYEGVLSVQCLTQTMDSMRARIAVALDLVFTPDWILFDGSSPFRRLENLPDDRLLMKRDGEEWLTEKLEDGHAPLVKTIKPAGFAMELDFCSVQKGGLFLDQVENWQRVSRCATGAEVLDLCCYHGGWGLAALQTGAVRADFVDRSRDALDRVRRNLELGAFAGEHRTLCGDVFDLMKQLQREGRRYRLVVSDPPAFVKSRKRFAEGRQGYIDLNRQAMQLVENGGFLAACSCSHHMGAEAFRDVLRLSAKRAGKQIRILASLEQGEDHPWLPQVLESHYLKGYLLQVEENEG
jgi:23S rRNA (cytosine1962-C5)-methyltransferase